MSVVVIEWDMHTPHSSLLLTNVKLPSKLSTEDKELIDKLKCESGFYISVYDGSWSKRFTTRTLKKDMLAGRIVADVTIPSAEDGFDSGLSEGLILRSFLELYKLKALSDKKLKERKESSSTHSAKLSLTHTFTHFKWISFTCTRFAYELLKRGGANFLAKPFKSPHLILPHQLSAYANDLRQKVSRELENLPGPYADIHNDDDDPKKQTIPPTYPKLTESEKIEKHTQNLTMRMSLQR